MHFPVSAHAGTAVATACERRWKRSVMAAREERVCAVREIRVLAAVRCAGGRAGVAGSRFLAFASADR